MYNLIDEVRKKPDCIRLLSDYLNVYFLFTNATAGNFDAAPDAVIFLQLFFTRFLLPFAAGI
jgi:hypothetical protein